MLLFLPSSILGSISTVVLALHTTFWATLIFLVALAKLIIPVPGWRRLCMQWMTWLVGGWINTNNVYMRLVLKTEWDISGLDGLKPDGWYLISSNHQTWLDIPVLFKVFHNRIPLLRFFLKQELIWVPMIGLACWAMDFPFMKRYSREFLEKYPELRGKDLETTRKACERYKESPVSILNFLEGTRFTAVKHARQNSPYRYLLRPKAGGFAFVLGAMGEIFDALLDVTIIYPYNPPSLWYLLSGRVPRIVIRIEQIAIPAEFLYGDYMDDPVFREQFQAWVRELWHNKNMLIEQTLKQVELKEV